MKKSKQLTKDIDDTHITIRLPVSLRNDFKSIVAKDGKTVREVITQLMEDYVKRNS